MIFTLIHKILKKRRLIKKYELTTTKKRQDLEIMRLMKGDIQFRRFLLNERLCEQRCITRLKKL